MFSASLTSDKFRKGGFVFFFVEFSEQVSAGESLRCKLESFLIKSFCFVAHLKSSIHKAKLD